MQMLQADLHLSVTGIKQSGLVGYVSEFQSLITLIGLIFIKIKSFFIICPPTPIFLLKVTGTQDIFYHVLIIVTFNCSHKVNLMGAFNFIGTFACLVFRVFSLAAFIFNFLQKLHTGVSSGICVNNEFINIHKFFDADNL